MRSLQVADDPLGDRGDPFRRPLILDHREKAPAAKGDI